MRDMIGYGSHPPGIIWPNKASIAVNFVINYEEGAELTPLNGDATCETYGGEFSLSARPRGMRSLSMESLFEYGSRRGIWRLLHLFDSRKIPLTFFITGLALTLNPEFCLYLRQNDHEVAGHGWRWIDYARISLQEEKKHITKCIETIRHLTGKEVYGWYTGRCSEHTRALLQQHRGIIYDSDSYADDLPFYSNNHLIIPYTLDCNDFRFYTNPGFSTAEDFFLYLKKAFDYLYQERQPAVMTIGLHPRISGRPARCHALQQFLDYLKEFPDIWITRRIDIARYWRHHFPPAK
ncbi:polysaccharide deacetylase family protein [Legionella londiniensis]|nr:polysaccharide deacetylase family protein [Legionella londiniensis]